MTPEPSAEQVIAIALTYGPDLSHQHTAKRIMERLAEAGFSLVKEGEQLTAEEADEVSLRVAAEADDAYDRGETGPFVRSYSKLRRLASGENDG